jgi:hypothetical protein
MPNLPTNPTKSDLLEKYWLDFLRHQKKDLDNRKGTGWGTPNGVMFDENAFWRWLLEERPAVLENGQSTPTAA